MKRFGALCLVMLLFCACANGVPSASPSVLPDSTRLSASPVVSASIAPTQTPAPTKEPTPTLAPTKEPTPTPYATNPFETPSPFPRSNPSYAPEDAPEGYTGTYLIKVARMENRVCVYERGEDGSYSDCVQVFICSAGFYGRTWDMTPEGTYFTTNKYEWRSLYGGKFGQYATRIHGAILFHSVPYTQAHKDALLYEEYNKLGQAASQGCIRMTAQDAKWIYDHCRIGTCVMIYDCVQEEIQPSAAPYIDPESPYRCWDPTDPDENNPWKRS